MEIRFVCKNFSYIVLMHFEFRISFTMNWNGLRDILEKFMVIRDTNNEF